jgi:hypothetical protein
MSSIRIIIILTRKHTIQLHFNKIYFKSNISLIGHNYFHLPLSPCHHFQNQSFSLEFTKVTNLEVYILSYY